MINDDSDKNRLLVDLYRYLFNLAEQIEFRIMTTAIIKINIIVIMNTCDDKR